MKHKYRVFEAFPDGRTDDARGTIELDEGSNRIDIAEGIFTLYGFGPDYRSYFYTYGDVGAQEIDVRYGYGSSGKRHWLLVKGG